MTARSTTFAYPSWSERIPAEPLEAGRYRVRFARNEADLDRLFQLRYEVFNLELHEGLDEAHRTGRDEDEFDRQFHHLLIEERTGGAVVGTYRMQTGEMAAAGLGYYSAGEFDLSTLPRDMLDRAVEIGRACVARDHRNGRVLHLLWRGLALYLQWNRKTLLFGCCSLTSQDPVLGRAVHQHLAGGGSVHPSLRVAPRPDAACEIEEEGATLAEPRVPALFQAYLSLGAKVMSPPAIDRRFRTIDWLVVLNVEELDASTFRKFFQ